MRVEWRESDRAGSKGIFTYIGGEGETADQVWDEAMKEVREEFPDHSVIFLGPVEDNNVIVLEVVAR